MSLIQGRCISHRDCVECLPGYDVVTLTTHCLTCVYVLDMWYVQDKDLRHAWYFVMIWW